MTDAEEFAKLVDAKISMWTGGDPALERLMDLCVKRVLVRDYRSDQRPHFDKVGEVARMKGLVIGHIADWLRAALFNGAKWLENVDDGGRQRKLLKFGSIEAITAEADRDMKRDIARLAGTALAEGDEAVEMDLGDGWTLVRLLTAKALDLESGRMQHCIGSGGYDEMVAGGASKFLSLRDPHGKPHATIHVEDGSIQELSGKQNETPLPKYLRRLAPYLVSLGDEGYLDGSYGVVVDMDGNAYDYSTLPDVLRVRGNLHLTDAERDGPFKLPRVIRTGGYVSVDEDIFEGDIETVQAISVYFGGMKMARLPDLVGVEYLDLTSADIEVLPSGLSLTSNLILKGATLRELPAGLKVGRMLDVSGTDMAAIPADTLVGSINADDSAVATLSSQTGYQSLSARNSQLSRLPDGLYVEGDLDISETSVTRLPHDLHVGGILKAARCALRLPCRMPRVRAADFTAATLWMPADFEWQASVCFRAARMNLRGARLACGKGIDLTAAHFDGLPAVIRAETVNLRRMMAAPMDVLDIDLRVKTLIVSDADLHIGTGVLVEDWIVIENEVERGFWFHPAAAVDYLGRRSDFSGLEAASDYYGATAKGYDHLRPTLQQPTQRT